MKTKILAILCVLSLTTYGRSISVSRPSVSRPVSRPASVSRPSSVRVSAPRPVPKSSTPVFKSTPRPTTPKPSTSVKSTTTKTYTAPKTNNTINSNSTYSSFSDSNSNNYNTGTSSAFYNSNNGSSGSSFLSNYMWYKMLFDNKSHNEDSGKSRDERIIEKLRNKIKVLREDKTKDNSEEIRICEAIIEALSTK